jgi:hypothetical protein
MNKFTLDESQGYEDHISVSLSSLCPVCNSTPYKTEPEGKEFFKKYSQQVVNEINTYEAEKRSKEEQKGKSEEKKVDDSYSFAGVQEKCSNP